MLGLGCLVNSCEFSIKLNFSSLCIGSFKNVVVIVSRPASDGKPISYYYVIQSEIIIINLPVPDLKN